MPLLLAACSVPASTIDKDLLSAQVQQQLTRQLGTQAPTTLESGAGNYDVGNALFDAKVVDKPNP